MQCSCNAIAVGAATHEMYHPRLKRRKMRQVPGMNAGARARQPVGDEYAMHRGLKVSETELLVVVADYGYTEGPWRKHLPKAHTR